MTPCIECDSTAGIERVTVLESTDGPVLLARRRCRADVSHWWDEPTDAALGLEPMTETVLAVNAHPSLAR
jgi:hypothetical protein